MRVLCYLSGMTEHAQSKSKRAAIGAGISFQPELWERLEAEAAKLERPNRSVIVERALIQYFRALDSRKDGEPVVVVLAEGAA